MQKSSRQRLETTFETIKMYNSGTIKCRRSKAESRIEPWIVEFSMDLSSHEIDFIFYSYLLILQLQRKEEKVSDYKIIHPNFWKFGKYKNSSKNKSIHKQTIKDRRMNIFFMLPGLNYSCKHFSLNVTFLINFNIYIFLHHMLVECLLHS